MKQFPPFSLPYQQLSAHIAIYEKKKAVPDIQEVQQNIGKVAYYPISQIYPGQVRISYQNMLKKLKKSIKRTGTKFDEKSMKWCLKYNEGSALLSLNSPSLGILGKDRILLLDGHHSLMGSVAIGSTSAPVKIIEDWSHLEVDTFYKKAMEQGYLHLQTIKRKTVLEPQFFSKLENDPNRYLAAVIARKIKTANGTIKSDKGSNFPIWIKVDKDIPFIEFHIADALYKAGIVYDTKWKKKIPMDVRAKIRSALSTARQEKQSHLLGKLKLVEKEIPIEKLDLTQYLPNK